MIWSGKYSAAAIEVMATNKKRTESASDQVRKVQAIFADRGGSLLKTNFSVGVNIYSANVTSY